MRPHRWQPTRLPRPWDSPGKNTGVGCHFLLQCMKVKSESEVAQSCPTLSDPMDCSLLGSSSMGFSRQEYRSGVPLPSLVDSDCSLEIKRCLACCSPWDYKELDKTEWLHFHFSLSRIGEGNGNQLQCSCLENPRDGGAWWAAVYGVTQSRTWLKSLSSSSSSHHLQ